jgi:hypothetical protein
VIRRIGGFVEKFGSSSDEGYYEAFDERMKQVELVSGPFVPTGNEKDEESRISK